MPIPAPRTDESENDFITRAHKLLAAEYPQTDERNAVIYSAWRQSKGESPLEKKAAEKFSADAGYELFRDVPVWVEHEYQKHDGEVIKHDYDSLRAICEMNNHRIADTGDFAAMSDGHVPDDEALPVPDLLGFSGPFRLGMVGNETPKWALFADEHHKVSKRDRIRDLPRRSPEVWLTDNPADRFMDPIAALGSKTPRLAMGVNYCRPGRINGKTVAKYSADGGGMGGACFPGATNVSIPSEVGGSKSKKVNYEEPEKMALSDEDIKQIVDAMNETKPMQFLLAFMQQVEDAQAANAEKPEEEVPEEGAVPEKAAEPVAPGAPQAPVTEKPTPSAATETPPAAPPEKEPPVSGPPAAPDNPTEPKEKEKSAMPNAQYAMPAEQRALYAKQEARIKALETELASEKTEKTIASRKSRIQALRQHAEFDETRIEKYALAKNTDGTLKMDDDQFLNTLEVVTATAPAIIIGRGFLPTTGDTGPVSAVTREKYERDMKDKVIDIVTMTRARGKDMSYDEAKAAYQKEHPMPTGATV